MEVYDSVYHNDIIALTEAQLNQGIPDEEIFINSFSTKPFRKDDPVGDGYRGICVYHQENLPRNGAVILGCYLPRSMLLKLF